MPPKTHDAAPVLRRQGHRRDCCMDAFGGHPSSASNALARAVAWRGVKCGCSQGAVEWVSKSSVFGLLTNYIE